MPSVDIVLPTSPATIPAPPVHWSTSPEQSVATPADAVPKEKSDKIVTPSPRATNALEQHEPDVLGAHLGALPVVEVVLQVPVANPKFQIF